MYLCQRSLVVLIAVPMHTRDPRIGISGSPQWITLQIISTLTTSYSHNSSFSGTQAHMYTTFLVPLAEHLYTVSLCSHSRPKSSITTSSTSSTVGVKTTIKTLIQRFQSFHLSVSQLEVKDICVGCDTRRGVGLGERDEPESEYSIRIKGILSPNFVISATTIF